MADGAAADPSRRGFRDRFTAIWQRRWFLVSFVVGTLVGVLLSQVAAVDWSWPSPDEDSHKNELIVLSGRDDSTNRQRQRLIETWNALHPDKQARIVELSANSDEQYSSMRSRAQTKERDVDVYNLDVTWTAEFAENNWIRPLPDVADTEAGEEFLAGPLETCRYEGSLWALPFNTDAGLLYYRPAELARIGIKDPPSELTRNHLESWRAIEKLGIDTREGRPKPTLRPDVTADFAAQFADYEGLTVNALEALWSEDGDALEDGSVVLDSARTREALNEVRRRFQSPGFFLRESRGYQEADATAAFREGRVQFMRNWPVAYRQLSSTEATAPGTQALVADRDFAVAPLPGPSALGGQNLAVSTESLRPKAARELVEFLTSAASQQILFQDGGLAATRERVYRDPRIQQQYPYAATLLTAIEQARPRPVTPHYGRFSEVFRQIMADVLDSGREITDGDVRRLKDALEGKQQ